MLQDNTRHSSDPWSFQPFEFEIDLFNHRLFLLEVLILFCVCSVISLPNPLCRSLFNSILINEQIHPGEINTESYHGFLTMLREKIL